MNQEKTFEELNAIADEIEVAERPWVAAWARINADASETAGVPTSQLIAELERATEELGQFIGSKAKQIADITDNSESNIRMGFGPRKEGRDCWFDAYPARPASWFLRQVAKHRSFNTTYWTDQEMKAEREAFLLKSNPSAEVVSADKAAALMKAGEVPNVDAQDFVRGGIRPAMHERESGCLSALERAMVRAGLLEPYDKANDDRVSTTQSVAFVLKGGQGEEEFVYWTKGVARQRATIAPLEQEDSSPAFSPRC